MRHLAIAMLAACGGSSAAPGDGGADGPEPDAPGAGACDAPPLFDDGLAPSRTLYVAPGGTGDGSRGAPFGAVAAAAAAATPGTAIRLLPGDHATGQFVSQLRGAADAPIWIGGEPGATPRPRFAGGAQALQLQRAAYVVVHDLEITGATANGINIDDGGLFDDPTASHHVAIARLHVHDVGTGGNNDCIKVSGIRDLAIYDSRLERCGAGGSGVDHVGCHRSVVARNVFDGAMATAVQAKGGSADVDVRQNRIRITGARAINLGGSTDLDLFRPSLSASAPNAEARRIRVFDNIITGLGASATPFAFVGCVDCLAAHNLVRGEQRWHVRILQETADGAGGYAFEPARGGRVVANTFVFRAASLATAVNVGAGTDAPSFTFANNLWYASDAPAQSAPQLPVAETGGIAGTASGYAGVPDDPHAPLPAACASGPEAAAAAPVPEVTGTFDGACRGTPRSIGPFEACPR